MADPSFRLLAFFVFTCCISPDHILAGSASKLDSAWRTYANKKLGYCVEYPSRWVRATAFEGEGIYFETGEKKFSLPIAEIDVSVLDDKILQTEDYVRIHLEGLRKFERAEQVEILESRAIALPNAAGLLNKNRYFDPQDGKPWVDELVVAVHGQKLYRLELECRADRIGRFEPVFARVLKSFRLDCNERHWYSRQ
jgi:hypothetical protein